MCNDPNAPPAPYLGGAIASIRSLNASTNSDYILRFSNPSCSEQMTAVTCEVIAGQGRRLSNDSERSFGSGFSTRNGDEELVAHIHKLGDMTSPENSVLHSVALEARDDGLETRTIMGKRLGLEVGGEGIIGRGISVVRRGEIVGVGIVGWQ